ncbi:MAG: FixH family protein [Dissulfurispiraceae bacterium]
MRKLVLLIIILMMTCVVTVYADVFMTKRAGDYTVTARFENYPPVLGNNNLLITIKDKAGQPVEDAKVSVKYYVVAERQSTQKPYTEYNTDAKAMGSEYMAIMNLTMKGPWYIETKFVRGGKEEWAIVHFHVK